MKTSHERIELLEKLADGITSWIGSIPSLIIHTLLFITSFLLPFFGVVDFDKMLLVLTTVLSLEAIYLSILIQMSVNKSHEKIEDIQEDLEEISEDIEDIQEDLEEITEDIEDIQEDIEEINEDDDDDDHEERAKKTILKSNVNSNKNEIKVLKDKIQELQNMIDELKKD